MSTKHVGCHLNSEWKMEEVLTTNPISIWISRRHTFKGLFTLITSNGPPFYELMSVDHFILRFFSAAEEIEEVDRIFLFLLKISILPQCYSEKDFQSSVKCLNDFFFKSNSRTSLGS